LTADPARGFVGAAEVNGNPMAQVTVTIDGKAYRMACEEGQEDHLTDLAMRFDRYVSHLKGQFGEIGDLRVTVMAGIMVMDELSELTRQVAALQSELDALRSNRDTAVAANARTEEMLAGALGEVTASIRDITEKLTARPPSTAN
jgi:cell division protein ZapA